MLRFAAQFKIFLACGHSYECSAAVVDEQQLFIGKRTACEACQHPRAEASAPQEVR
jgi:hypothetical protein